MQEMIPFEGTNKVTETPEVRVGVSIKPQNRGRISERKMVFGSIFSGKEIKESENGGRSVRRLSYNSFKQWKLAGYDQELGFKDQRAQKRDNFSTNVNGNSEFSEAQMGTEVESEMSLDDVEDSNIKLENDDSLNGFCASEESLSEEKFDAWDSLNWGDGLGHQEKTKRENIESTTVVENLEEEDTDSQTNARKTKLKNRSDSLTAEESDVIAKEMKKRVKKLSKKKDDKQVDMKNLVTAVLVGRPNVGKSALYNRLTGRQEALVYNTPDSHVTRDHREGIGRVGDLRLKVIDTAGLEPMAGTETVLGRTANLTHNVMKRCQLAIFLLDGRAGIQPHDYEVASWLRRTAPHLHIILLVNKCEGFEGDHSGLLQSTLGEAHRFGFGDPIPISAETGEGFSNLYGELQPILDSMTLEKEALNTGKDLGDDSSFDPLKDSPSDSQATTDTDNDVSVSKEKSLGNEEVEIPLQLAICGRPNVGKSTLMNALLGEERSLTGPEPGLTRDAVREKFVYNGREIWLVDTAGWIQRAEVKGEGPSAMAAQDARRRLKRAQVVALVLDATEIAEARVTLRRTEMALARWVVEEGRALIIVVNKMDVLEKSSYNDVRQRLAKAVPIEVKAALPQIGEVPLLFTSALKGEVREELMEAMERSYKKWCMRLPTAALNRWLRKLKAMTSEKKSHSGSVQYLTQTKARPPTFVAFTSGSQELGEGELRHLSASLRESFDLEGTPIRVYQRHKPQSKNYTPSKKKSSQKKV